MSNEQAIATYIASAFTAFSNNQEQTNAHLSDIKCDLKDVKKILGEHDTRLHIHDKDIKIVEGAIKVNCDDIVDLKKKMLYLMIASALSVVSSAASIMQGFGVKMPVFGFLLKLFGA